MTDLRISLLLLTLLLLGACSSDPMEVLEQAQTNFQQSEYIRYQFTSYWPNPAGKVDTTSGKMTFLKQDNDLYPYSYIGRDPRFDLIYIDNRFQKVDHTDSLVYNYSAADLEKDAHSVRENTFLHFSPLKFLQETDWTFEKDTIVDGNELLGFKRVEMDTTIEDKHIYVENHIFLDPAAATLNVYERRAFLNGENSQNIILHFADYDFANDPEPLTYSLPQHYRSKAYGDREKLQLLQAGQPAPDFDLTDTDGQSVKLADLKGQKVLLDFSVINCGYCKLALEHLNQEDYELSQNLNGIYINPEDDAADMRDYAAKIPVPFPILAGAKDVGRAYGVSAYPTFFIIDEEGIIERVFLGYEKEFLESIKATEL
ncbi:peroxiredoxin family protein [Flavilitoribacter nigricans]|uniref:Thioredoxin domain-containing protein n=1 Tax=Flavilitoribacter nigricans (strain ATCC 23147 / DSM 23189 / NBRC 102662 / NCIMB 1420 / SS-2) TaxID=1122177 RepID=A0A2D0N717_FLAN2|nr:TlpA disulfide reductase family protein [Flavilitoribacter nigricans]PHN04295.1 hypothetical protein CRP01_22290 [Flavilitoribacter nigricans DSM 23189 = NBRC 102662]